MNENLQHATWVQFLDIIRHNQHADTHLDLSDLALNDAKCAELVLALTNNTYVKSLNLARNKIGAAGAASLSKLKNLTSLNVGRNQIDDAAAEHLSELTNLTNLNVWYNNIGPAGAEHLSALTNLNSLNINYNDIGAAGVASLSKLQNLTSLYVSMNRIGAAGAEHLSRLKKLTMLDVSGNEIGIAGATSLSTLTSLINLDVAFNRIDATQKAALFAVLPNIVHRSSDINIISVFGVRTINTIIKRYKRREECLYSDLNILIPEVKTIIFSYLNDNASIKSITELQKLTYKELTEKARRNKSRNPCARFGCFIS